MMPDDDEFIAKAREMLRRIKGGNFYVDGTIDDVERLIKLTPLLADIAEKRGAMAVEERAWFIFLDQDRTSRNIINEVGLKKFREDCENPVGFGTKTMGISWKEKAAKELDIEYTSWRKIGQEEVEAIKWAIYVLRNCMAVAGEKITFVEMTDVSEVLRRLIDSGHHIGEVNEMVSEE
jgi:hypothetical protein